MKKNVIKVSRDGVKMTYHQQHKLQLILIVHFHVQDDLPENNNNNKNMNFPKNSAIFFSWFESNQNYRVHS